MLRGMRFGPMGLAVAMALVLASRANAEEQAAQEKPWSVEVQTAYLSRYVWRGLNLTDDPVSQSSVTFAWKGLSLNLWGNMDLTDVNGNNDEFNEVDYTLDYSGSCGKLNYSVGAIRYHFPNTNFAGTTEVYGALGLDVPLSPTLTVYADVDEADGWYGTFSIGHTFENVVTVSESVAASLELSASIAYADSDYNNFYFGVDESGFVDALFGVGLPVTVGDHVTVTPSIGYSNIIDSDLAAAAGKD